MNHKAVVQIRKKPAVLFQHRRNVTAYYQEFSNILPLFSLLFLISASHSDLSPVWMTTFCFNYQEMMMVSPSTLWRSHLCFL